MHVVNIPVEALNRIATAKTKQPSEESGGFFPEAGSETSGPASGEEPAGAEKQAAPAGTVECEIRISDADVPLGQRCENDVINIAADEKAVEVDEETSNLSDENKAALNELRERLQKADKQQEAELNKMVSDAKEAVTSAVSA